MDIISKCSPSDFIDNLRELQSYRQAKIKGLEISNAERLILLIKRYYETLLYYQEKSPRKHIVKIHSKEYLVEISGHDGSGLPKKFDLSEICEQLLKDVIVDLKGSLRTENYCQITELFTRILNTPKVHNVHKIAILNAEHVVFGENWQALIRLLPEEIALNAINARKKLTIRLLSGASEQLFDPSLLQQGIDDLHRSYEGWIKTQIKIFISNNHFVDILNFLIAEAGFLKTLESKDINKQRLIKFVLSEITAINHLFHLESRERIDDYIQKFQNFLSKEIIQALHQDLYFNPQNFDLGDTFVEMVSPDFSDVPEDQIKTVISFVVPYQIDLEYVEVEASTSSKFSFKTIKNLFDDPVFAFLDSSNLLLNGLPLTFFSDAIGRISECTQVNLILNQFYHPDFDILDGQIAKIDLSEEKAKRGGKYLPHKDIILEEFWKLLDGGKCPISVDKSMVDSNFISNYLVSYLNQKSELIHHQVHLITNFNSYYQARDRYLQSISQQYFANDTNDLRDLVFNVEITSNSVFLDFCYKLLKLTLIKAVEQGGLYRSFWKAVGEPKIEREVQPIIYNQLRFVSEIKGIKLTREVGAAEGSLDFSFFYTKNDRSMTVCVELKNAHHENLEHGINTQLPLYIKDIGNKEGIFLVLWYKCDEFDKPEAFTEPDQLNNHLLNEIPTANDIRILIMDCTRKLPPSHSSRTINN